MGKKVMKFCALAATGAMVFQFGGGACLGWAFKAYGQSLVYGSGWETGRDLTQTYLLAGITNSQDAVNAVNFQEAVDAELAARAGG